ncbi:hypothetical protein BH09SUM1_BH09SUM1_18720 [soil metagenome]
MNRKIRKAAIIGGGPAGAIVAGVLARSGVEVAIIANRKRPPLIVGESLVPAVIPLLRELGVEDEVASFGKYKPGATFFPTPNEELTYPFSEVRTSLPKYAYNVPRLQFDDALLQGALKAGATLVEANASLEKVGTDEVRLSEETTAAANGFSPDIIIDGTGRTRQLGRLLDVPSERGERNDSAIFAHLDKSEIAREGNIHIDRLYRGWSWRIPLRDRVSIGIVIDSEHLKAHGGSAEEQFDAMLRNDPILAKITAGATRLSPVMRYSNYQLITHRACGANWAMVGDAMGFIDPIFSSGTYLALDGGFRLASAILDGSDVAMARYERQQLAHLQHWRTIISSFYDGRFLTMLRHGHEMRATAIGRLFNPHLRRHLGRIFIGSAASRRYSRVLLRFMSTQGIRRRDHRVLRIN